MNLRLHLIKMFGLEQADVQAPAVKHMPEEYLKVSSKKLLSVVTMKMERKIPIKSFSYIKQDSKMKLETQKNDLGRNQKQ